MDQLKEELGARDLSLVKQRFDALRLEKERDGLAAQLSRLRRVAVQTNQ